jgi:hypothetical protein
MVFAQKQAAKWAATSGSLSYLRSSAWLWQGEKGTTTTTTTTIKKEHHHHQH